MSGVDAVLSDNVFVYVLCVSRRDMSSPVVDSRSSWGGWRRTCRRPTNTAMSVPGSSYRVCDAVLIVSVYLYIYIYIYIYML